MLFTNFRDFTKGGYRPVTESIVGTWFGLSIASNIIHGTVAFDTILTDPKYTDYIISECEKIVVREQKANPNMTPDVSFSLSVVLRAIGRAYEVLFGGVFRQMNMCPLKSSKYGELDIEVVQRADNDKEAHIASIKFLMQDKTTGELYWFPVNPPKRPLK